MPEGSTAFVTTDLMGPPPPAVAGLGPRLGLSLPPPLPAALAGRSWGSEATPLPQPPRLAAMAAMCGIEFGRGSPAPTWTGSRLGWPIEMPVPPAPPPAQVFAFVVGERHAELL